jgi:hypothetical protein
MSAYVSMRQHTSAYISVCQSFPGARKRPLCRVMSAYVSISMRQHTAAYGSIRQRMSIVSRCGEATCRRQSLSLDELRCRDLMLLNAYLRTEEAHALKEAVEGRRGSG